MEDITVVDCSCCMVRAVVRHCSQFASSHYFLAVLVVIVY